MSRSIGRRVLVGSALCALVVVGSALPSGAGIMFNVSVSKTDGVTTAIPGTTVTYTITVDNTGPSATTATITDSFSSQLTSVSWTCSAAGGATCGAAAGTGDINLTLTLPNGGSVVYTVTAQLDRCATGTLVNTVTVAPSPGDTNPSDNAATDIDTIEPGDCPPPDGGTPPDGGAPAGDANAAASAVVAQPRTTG